MTDVVLNSQLLEATRKLLKDRPKNITLRLIEEETKLTHDWLESILYRDFDAGVKKIELLFRYLGGTNITFECFNHLNEIEEE